MTRETAINLLDNLIGMVEDNQQNDYDEAFKMAIRSLKSWDEDVTTVVHGAWVVDENSAYIDAHCSECGMQVRYNKFQQFDCFCRRCGAKMDGEI